MSSPYETVGGGLKLKGGHSKIGKRKKKKKEGTDTILDMASKSHEEKNEHTNIDKEDNKTQAEKAFEEAQEKRAAERILKKASKSHKQRVEELNEYLGGLSEHYDIQKVSWTK